jgi:hypothetical protein
VANTPAVLVPSRAVRKAGSLFKKRQHGRASYFNFFAFVAGGEIFVFTRLRQQVFLSFRFLKPLSRQAHFLRLQVPEIPIADLLPLSSHYESLDHARQPQEAVGPSEKPLQR